MSSFTLIKSNRMAKYMHAYISRTSYIEWLQIHSKLEIRVAVYFTDLRTS